MPRGVNTFASHCRKYLLHVVYYFESRMQVNTKYFLFSLTSKTVLILSVTEMLLLVGGEFYFCVRAPKNCSSYFAFHIPTSLISTTSIGPGVKPSFLFRVRAQSPSLHRPTCDVLSPTAVLPV